MDISDITITIGSEPNVAEIDGAVALALLDKILDGSGTINGIPRVDGSVLDLDLGSGDRAMEFFDSVWNRIITEVREHAPLNPNDLTFSTWGLPMTLADAAWSLHSLNTFLDLATESVSPLVLVPIHCIEGDRALQANEAFFLRARDRLDIVVECLTVAALGKKLWGPPENFKDCLQLSSDVSMAMAKHTGDAKRAGKISATQRDAIRAVMGPRGQALFIQLNNCLDKGWELPEQIAWLQHELGMSLLLAWLADGCADAAQVEW